MKFHLGFLFTFEEREPAGHSTMMGLVNDFIADQRFVRFGDLDSRVLSNVTESSTSFARDFLPPFRRSALTNMDCIL